jgi:hypothetical protein
LIIRFHSGDESGCDFTYSSANGVIGFAARFSSSKTASVEVRPSLNNKTFLLSRHFLPLPVNGSKMYFCAMAFTMIRNYHLFQP